jgi:hypothetical protein
MHWPNSKLRRFVVNSILVWPMLWLYMLINHHQAPPSNTVLMPSWVPFWPAFFPVYVAMLLVTWLLPVAIGDAGRFRACLRCERLRLVAGHTLVDTLTHHDAAACVTGRCVGLCFRLGLDS